jgi:predicted  nucleic acid-binding Zn-ribbon protein
MSEKKEQKKLRKVKKKWIVVSAGIWVGLLSTIVAAANPESLPEAIKQFIPGLSGEGQKVDPNVQLISNEILGDQIREHTGQSVNLNDDNVRKLNEIMQIVFAEQALDLDGAPETDLDGEQALDLDGAPETDLDGQQLDMLDKQQIKDILNVLTSEANHNATPQQIGQSVVRVVSGESEAVPPDIQKVFEHLDRVIKLPSSEELAQKEEIEAREKELEELQKSLKEKDLQIQKIQSTNEVLSEQIDKVELSLNDHNDRIIELKATIEERERELDIYKREVSETEAELRGVDSKIAETENPEEKLKLNAKARVLREKLLTAQKDLEDLNKKVTEDSQKLKEHQEITEKLNKEIENKKLKLQNNKERISRLMSAASGAAEDFSGIDIPLPDALLEEKSLKIDELQTKINQIKERLEKLNNGEVPVELMGMLLPSSSGSPGVPGIPPPPPPPTSNACTCFKLKIFINFCC